MSKAYFTINMGGKKLNGIIKISSASTGAKIYSLKNILWIKRPYFVMQKDDKNVKIVNLESIKRLL